MQVQLRYRNIFCQTQTDFTMYIFTMYHLRIVLLVFIVRNVQNNLIDVLSTQFISYAPYYIYGICWYRQMIIYNTVNRDYFDQFLTSNHFFTNFPMSNFIFEIWKMIPELLAFQLYIFIVFSYQGGGGELSPLKGQNQSSQIVQAGLFYTVYKIYRFVLNECL